MKINRNYPVTREVTDQGAQLVISVVPHYSLDKRECYLDYTTVLQLLLSLITNAVNLTAVTLPFLWVV